MYRESERRRERGNVRNWLTQLWRSRSPNIRSPHTGDTGGLLVCFQSEFKRLLEPLVQVLVEGERRLMSQLKSSGGQSSPLLSLFLLFRFSVIGWDPSTLGRAICSTQFKCHLIQKHSHTHTQNIIWSNVWIPCGPVKLTHKINHHTIWNHSTFLWKITFEGTAITLRIFDFPPIILIEAIRICKCGLPSHFYGPIDSWTINCVL